MNRRGTPKTRVVQSYADLGKWQAQYWDALLSVWCDIGDAKNMLELAQSDERAYLARYTEGLVPPRSGRLKCRTWRKRGHERVYCSQSIGHIGPCDWATR